MLKGITSYYEYANKNVEELARGMMLREANEDHDIFLIECIDKKMEDFEKYYRKSYTKKQYKESYAHLCYWKGRIMSENSFLNDNYREDGEYFLNKAYKSGSGDAAAFLGYCYYTGQHLTNYVNEKKAMKFFNKAKKMNGYFTEYWIGKALTHEQEDLDKIREAQKYYKIAVKKKIIDAKKELALAYIATGENLDDAEKLIKSASRSSGDDYYGILNTIKNMKNRKPR